MGSSGSWSNVKGSNKSDSSNKKEADDINCPSTFLTVRPPSTDAQRKKEAGDMLDNEVV